MRLTFEGSRTLWAGYAAFAAFFVLWPVFYGTIGSEISSKRIGSADSFTIIFTHGLLVASFIAVFFMKNTDAVITATAVNHWVLGAVLEGGGWILQRLFWQPWYVYKELANMFPEMADELLMVPKLLESNVWLLTFAYVLIWIGCGLQMNIAFRTVLKGNYRLWPFIWLAIVVSSWCIGYMLPDVVGSFYA